MIFHRDQAAHKDKQILFINIGIMSHKNEKQQIQLTASYNRHSGPKYHVL
jgi:hypothetical protein